MRSTTPRKLLASRMCILPDESKRMKAEKFFEYDTDEELGIVRGNSSAHNSEFLRSWEESGGVY